MPTFRPKFKTTDLTDRVVVITGAGSGIGRELALLCAERGAHLALCDINDAGLASTDEAARTLGAEVLTSQVDVSDAEAMARFANSTFARFGRVDLLVNNAGVGLVGGFLDTRRKDWEWLIGINLMGWCTAVMPSSPT